MATKKIADVAWKIYLGRKLTLEEFKIAHKDGMITGGVPLSDEELAKQYLYWQSQYYEDDDRYAILCDKHPTRLIKKEGSKETRCMWGIHMDEVKPEKLTKVNIKFLRHHFGKAKVKELTGR